MARHVVPLVGLALVASALGAPTYASPSGTATSAASAGRPAVIGRRVIGRSVRDRPIRAWELGRRSARRTAVVIAVMHGNETAPAQILRTLRDGRPITGIHLWVVPVYNPDGVARGTRQNAHGVDLNRNYPFRWRRQTGDHDSGPRPSSERETRVFQRWLNRVDPDVVVSFHQPLYGVDRLTKRRALARRLHRHLHLPLKSFSCDGGCHGTMTQWFNHRHDGAALTVELGYHPTWRYLHVKAPRGLLRALGASYA